MEGFDAYRKWLGIPPHEQPPNHYRLLGIGLFESDPEVIAAAAQRQIFNVRAYLSSPYAEISQFILNELATAQACLLDPQAKSQYDQWLQQTLPVEHQTPPPPRIVPMPADTYGYPAATAAAAAPPQTSSQAPWAGPAVAAGAAAGGRAGGTRPIMMGQPVATADDPLALGSYSSVSTGAARHVRAVHGKKKEMDKTVVGVAIAMVAVSVILLLVFLNMMLSSKGPSDADPNQPLFGPPVVVERIGRAPAKRESKPVEDSASRDRPVEHKSAPANNQGKHYHPDEIGPDLDFVPHFDKNAPSNTPPRHDQSKADTPQRDNPALNGGGGHPPDWEDITPGTPDKHAPDLPDHQQGIPNQQDPRGPNAK
jgi:hypothetical protein